MTADSTRAYYRLRTAKNKFNAAPQDLNPEQQQQLEQSVERQLLLEEKVLQTPEAAGVVISDASLRKAMETVEQQYPSCDEFLQDLDRVGLTVSRLSDLLERQQRVEAVLEQCSKQVPPVDTKSARAYYEAHPEKFTKPELREACHLLITVNPAYPENQRDRALARLEAIREAALKDPDQFQQQARLHSECPSALRGGELGWIPRGQLYPAIEEALFALPEGGVSPVIETEVGLHLVRCCAIKAPEKLTFVSMKETIIEKLTQAQQEQQQLNWLRSLS